MRTFWFLFLLFVTPGSDACPSSCRCVPLKVKKKETVGEVGLKITCNQANLTSLNFESVPNDVITLTISGTTLTKINSGQFTNLKSLTKLDLSRNKIVQIDNDAFINMTLIKKLNLSQNAITALNPEVLNGLSSLEKLDLRGNPLMCDCHLHWLLNWYRNNSVKTSLSPTCHYPGQLQGVPLLSLSPSKMHCNHPLQLPTFELRPSINQLVFEGDTLSLECLVSDIDSETRIIWLQNNDLIDEKSNSVQIHQIMESGLLISYLNLNSLLTNHTGTWMCHAGTKRGNLSRTVDILVVSQSSQSCPEEITTSNKGRYHWPPTLAGITVELPCVTVSPAVLSYKHPLAYRFCNKEGNWEKLETLDCPYVSEVTNILEQFAKTNLSQSDTVLNTARGLSNYTDDGRILTDVMDLVYITQTLQNYLALVPKNKELGKILLNVISAILGRDKSLLKEAQRVDKTCSKLSHLIESLATAMADSSINYMHPDLIVQEFLVKSDSFPGMRCSSFIDKSSSFGRNFHCISVNATLTLNFDKPIEASVYVPQSVFSSSRKSNQRVTTPSVSLPMMRGRKLQFTLHSTSALFPRPESAAAHHIDISSVVVSCQMFPAQAKNLIQPIEVTLQVPAITSDAKPARWDPSAAEGKGDWSTQGCNVHSIKDCSITFSCSHLGAYGILQDLVSMRNQLRFQLAQFRFTHPTIYVGSLISVSFLILSVMIFFKEWKNIRMPKKMKHSLLNTWIAIVTLVLTFTLGIAQTDIAILCQIVGLVTHYLTLCTFAWFIITANNMYKHLTRNDPIELVPDEPLPDPTVPPKPMLQFYLVGWGVGTIICGISAAVDVMAYHNSAFCFLSTTSRLAAIYGPVSAFILLLLAYFIAIKCHYSREIETSGVLLVGSPTNTYAETDSLVDLEFSPSTQLRALVIVLFLFVSAWFSAAVTIGRPLSNYVPYDALVFGLLYCALSSLLGVFVFSFYCYFRKDLNSKINWWVGNRRVSVKSIVSNSSSRRVTDNVIRAVPNTIGGPPVINLLNAAPSLAKEPVAMEKPRSVNLLSTHNPINDNINNSGVELFYNPRQSIVAKRFFEKNRRQQQLKALQKNNLAKAQTALESDLSSRARAYSDTEKASSTYHSGVEEKSHLCTSQSYSGAAAQFEFNDKAFQTALNVQNGLVELHADPAIAFAKPSSPTELNSREYYRTKDGAKVAKPRFSTTTTLGNCDRSSCSECSKCNHGKARSLCSQSCYSDFTSVSQNAQKRRSKSNRNNRWKKNSRQYSWDDKYDGRIKVFLQPPPPSSPGTVVADSEGKVVVPPTSVSRSNSRRKQKRRGESRGSNRSRERSFVRSQSAYEQISVNTNHFDIIDNDDLAKFKTNHLETRM